MRKFTFEEKLHTLGELYKRHSDFFLAPFDQHYVDPETDELNFGVTSNQKTFTAWLKTTPRETRTQYFQFNESFVNLLKEQKIFKKYHFALTGKSEYSERAVRQQDALSEGNPNIIYAFLEQHEMVVDFIFSNGNAIQNMTFSYEDYLIELENPAKKERRSEKRKSSPSSESDESESDSSEIDSESNDSEKENKGTPETTNDRPFKRAKISPSVVVGIFNTKKAPTPCRIERPAILSRSSTRSCMLFSPIKPASPMELESNSMELEKPANNLLCTETL